MVATPLKRLAQTWLMWDMFRFTREIGDAVLITIHADY